jgi:hypothetical protein
MAITDSDLVRRALQMKADGMASHVIGRRLLEIAKGSGHVRVELIVDRLGHVEVKLHDIRKTVSFDGKEWDSR